MVPPTTNTVNFAIVTAIAIANSVVALTVLLLLLPLYNKNK